MKIIQWGIQDWTTESNKLMYRDYNSNVLLKKIVTNESVREPRISSIEIETINRCNNDCSFCPVSRKHDIRTPKRMTEEVFYKIIDELEQRNYRGYISLFSNNEPLLDSRLIKFLSYAKKKLPYATHHLCTNGLLLTKEIYLQLITLLDYLVIDNYNDEMVLNPNIAELMELNAPENVTCEVEVYIRKKNQVLSNRGGNAHNKSSEQLFFSPCILPFFQLIIRPDGKLSQCCHDAYGKVTLGDVSQGTIQDAWESNTYENFRKVMKNEGGRSLVKTCAKCDTFGMYNLFPVEMLRLYTEAFIDIVWEAKHNSKKIVLISSGEIKESIIDILLAHGICPERYCNKLMKPVEDEFYIFTEYIDLDLEFFSPEEAGKSFIVYNNQTGHYSLRKKTSIKSEFAKLLKAQRENELLIFGAGNNAKRLYEKYGLLPAKYIDNNKERWGSLYYGKTIMGCTEELDDKKVVLVSASDFDTIRTQLLQCKIKEENIINGNELL